VLAANSTRVFEIYWAAQRSGLYYTPISHHLTAPEAAYIVANSGAKTLIVSSALADVAAEVARRVPGLKLALAFGGPVADTRITTQW
jgi:long-chain acyl-CoA synthetase